MSVRIVRLGSPRLPGEGPRLGTVRFPPRGVRKADLARLGYYDVWLPLLAPSRELLARGQHAGSDSDWNRFIRSYRAEMKAPDPARLLELLAVLSTVADFSVGCYCADEARCHRSVLRSLLTGQGAQVI